MYYLRLCAMPLIANLFVIGAAVMLITSSNSEKTLGVVAAFNLFASNLLLSVCVIFLYTLFRNYFVIRPYCSTILHLFILDHGNKNKIKLFFFLAAISDTLSFIIFTYALFFIYAPFALISFFAFILLMILCASMNRGINYGWEIEVGKLTSGSIVSSIDSKEQCIQYLHKKRIFAAWNLALGLGANMAPWRVFLQYKLMPLALYIAVIPAMSYYLIFKGVLAIADEKLSIGNFSSAFLLALLFTSFCSSSVSFFTLARLAQKGLEK